MPDFVDMAKSARDLMREEPGFQVRWGSQAVNKAIFALEMAFHRLVEAGGGTLTEAARTLLLRRADDLQETDKPLVSQLYDFAQRGFFNLAATGYALVPVDRIRNEMGKTLEQNYPEASRAFLKFATTYWTLRLLVDDVAEASVDDMVVDKPSLVDLTIAQLVTELEFETASVFFPTPGIGIPSSKREAAQREILAELALEIDAEDFIRGNPILIRDKAGESKLRLTRDHNPDEIKKYQHIKQGPLFGRAYCRARMPNERYVCTLPAGHEGPHVAHAPFHGVVAAWED